MTKKCTPLLLLRNFLLLSLSLFTINGCFGCCDEEQACRDYCESKGYTYAGSSPGGIASDITCDCYCNGDCMGVSNKKTYYINCP